MILESFVFLPAKCTFVRTYWFHVFVVLVAVVKSKVAIVKLRIANVETHKSPLLDTFHFLASS